MRTSTAAAVVVLFGLLGSCSGSTSHRDLSVTAFSPAQPVDATEPIEIQFDRPVVDEASVGRPAERDIVSTAPTFAWTGHWRDRQTLVLIPDGQLAPSTRYQIALRGALRDRTEGFTFSFVHQPLEVDGLWGVDVDSLPPDGELPIAFNQPVVARDAAARCRLVDGDGNKISLATKQPDRTDTTIALMPSTRLGAGAEYTLTCADLAGAGGNATLADPYTLAVRARPPLSVVSGTPSKDDDVPADEVTIAIELSTEVELDAIRKAISSTPVIPGLEHGWLDGSGAVYKVTVDLDTQTRYTIKVANLTDKFGQVLGAPFSTEFRTGDARPRLTMEHGIFALEASATGYPIWSRNLTEYDVECAPIPKTKLVHLLTGDMNYDPWGGNDTNKAIEWKKLDASARKKTFKVGDAKNKWHLDSLDLGATCGRSPGARGVYLAEVSSDQIVEDPNQPWRTPKKRRLLANVTDLGVLIKIGTASGIVWVTSIASGNPVPGAKVVVYTPQGRQVLVGVSDKDGIVKIPGSAVAKAQPSADDADGEMDGGDVEEWDSYRSQRLIATVEKAGDLAVVDGNWANGIQIWNFSVPEERLGGAVRIRGFIQSDRGLYRPGETVHFKGIVREIAQSRPPRVPQRGVVKYEVSDSRGSTVLRGEAKLSAFGGFDLDLPLSEQAALGDYYVKATLADQTFRERFMVEEYRPAAFELGVKGDGAARPGERMTFTANARYLFGAPVAGAEVEWNLRRRPHPVRFDGFDEYTFTESMGTWYYDYGRYRDDEDYGAFVADGTATTDASGNASIAVRDPDKLAADSGPQDYIVSINVTDDSDQTIGKSVTVTAHQQDVYLGVHAQEYVQAVGMPFGVNIVAVDPRGKRVATAAKLTFVRDEHRCTWTEVGNRSYQRCERQSAVAFERAIQIPATGTLTERIYPKDPGQYAVKIETTDARGTKVTTGSSVWVIGKGEAFWSGDESARMTLVASKPSYKPGDTARLVAQANLDRPMALITIERDGVLDAWTRRMSSAGEGVELAVKDAWAPNVFAGVTFVQGRRGFGDRGRPQMKMGIVELKVSAAHKQLAVDVSIDKPKVEPGETVTGTIRVTSGGAPVRAELSLSAADEGVLQLIAYQTPNPMTTFYATWGLGVDSGTNWNRIARLADPNAGDPDEGGDVAGASGNKIRSRFVSSAFWAPKLYTDARGEVAFSFVAPDNLTAFRLMAVAADAGDRFGAGEARLTVKKELMARPALPRFLGSNDSTAVGVVIHNNTDRGGVATVTASAVGVSLDRGRTEIAVPANGVARATFTARAAEVAAATFDFAVTMNGHRDAVRVTLPVARPRVIETRTVKSGVVPASGSSVAVPLAIGSGVLRGESELVVSIDRTGMGDLEPGLRYLVEYPYGCLEQTLSSFVPLTKAKDLSRSLGIESLEGTKMEAFIKAGVAKVARHQQGDGHFSLWPQSQTYPHLTTYAVWGLTEARKAGATVPQEPIDRALVALRGWTAQSTVNPDGDGATLAMAAYLLAHHGTPDAALNARLYAQRAGLPAWGQAFLLRALAASRGDAKEIAELQRILIAGLKKDGDKLVADEKGDDMHMGSASRATAMALVALLEVAPEEVAVDSLASGLLAQRRGDGRWANTQDNLWGLVALAEYARRASAGDTTITITAGAKQLLKQRLSGSAVGVVRAKLSDLATDSITISSSTGTPHFSVRVTEARRDDGKPKSKGFAVTRQYLDDAGKPLVKTIKAGDLVTVKLQVTADASRRWVALVDPLPAGFEVVNPRLASAVDTSRAGGGVGLGSSGSWWEVQWVHQEVRDDRVLWFADEMHDGTYTLSYKARATTAGTFAAGPTHVEAMYEPDAMGRTATGQVVIAP